MRRWTPLPLLALLILILTPASAPAQIAFKGGINLVDLFGDDVAASDTRPRLAGGLAASPWAVAAPRPGERRCPAERMMAVSDLKRPRTQEDS